MSSTRRSFASNAFTASATNDDVTPASVVGRAGLGAQLDGTGDSLVVGDPLSGALDFGESSLTVSAWVYVTSSAGEYDMVLHKAGASNSSPGYSRSLGTGLQCPSKRTPRR